MTPNWMSKALEIAVRLAEGAQSAIRWTKYALNNWLRMAGPSFDASLGHSSSWGSAGPRRKEGLASHKEKAAARSFPTGSGDLIAAFAATRLGMVRRDRTQPCVAL